MRAVCVAISLAVLFACNASAGNAREPERPPWLSSAIATVLDDQFRGTAPSRVDLLGYRRKIAVVLTFRRPIGNSALTGLDGEVLPGHRVWRISFDRVSRRQNPVWHTCPTRVACLYR